MSALPKILDPRWQRAFTERERVWAALRHLDRTVTPGEVYRLAGTGLGLTARLMMGWAERGLLLRQVNSTRFAMTKAARRHHKAPQIKTAKKVAPVPARSGRQRLWSAMRVLKTFDLTTLCMAAETSEVNALHFLRALQGCGYVRRDREMWRLLRDTGPRHPVISRRAAPLFTSPVLVDRNTGVVTDIVRRTPAKAPLVDGGIG